ncbi:MgtC/SapB family protein [Sphingomonas alba]|uniref:MgtC/SapB family protein n=1 Tax=Sphingomonas alba TaxID=2908208 RepID=A0ABT0RQ41_9SPHN|nr:MgtC/SapB family protein [Sphingomonas alba]MCL6684715.1 MgtC/SapB family protein [Sphingomonas alba]
MMNWQAEAYSVGGALAVGLLVGIERGWKQRREKPGSRIAGVRTFTLLGLGAGIAGLIGARGYSLAAGALIAGGVGLMTYGFGRELKAQRDSTTAVAALLTLAIGFLAGSGSAGLAIAAAAITISVLALKAEIHSFLDKLDEEDVKALARFSVIALAVLPFLPDQPFGPFDAWNASKLWWVVILVTGFSFAGYVANRIFGERHGTIATALIGGAYSSTAVTQSLAQRLGQDNSPGAEDAGIALATAVMYLRVLVLVGLLATRLTIPFLIVVAPPLIVSWLAGWWLYRNAPKCDAPAAPGNPIALLPALGFVLFLAVAAVAARWAQGRFGEQGIAWLLLFMGSLDVDAAIVTAGNLPPDAIAPQLAALALGGTILANMAVKLGITLAYARKKSLSAALALLASMVTLAASLVIGGLRL